MGALALLWLTLAVPCAAQPVYVLGVVGVDTMHEGRFERGGRAGTPVGGTDVGAGARVGVALGRQWGAELAFGRRAVSRTGTSAFPGRSGVPLLSTIMTLSSGDPRVAPKFRVDTEERHHRFGTLAWVRHDVAPRTALVLLGGLEFQRRHVDEGYSLVAGPQSISFSPEHLEFVSYAAQPVVGVEVQTVRGHLVIAPGVRLSGIVNGWSTELGIGVGWSF